MHRRAIHVVSAMALIGFAIGGVAIAAWRWSNPRASATPGRDLRAKQARTAAEPESQQHSAVATANRTSEKDNAFRDASLSQTVRTTKQPAHIDPFEQTAIYAKAAGFLSRVHVDLGSRIKKGDVLAELSIPEMDQERAQKQALVDEAKASVAQAEANVVAAKALIASATAKVRESKSLVTKYEAELAFRRSEHVRFSDLVRSKAVEEALLDEKLKQFHRAQAALGAAQASVTSAEANVEVELARLEQARANLVVAQARLKVAEADLKRMQVLIEYAIIRAPYAGVIVERLVNTGDFAQSAADGKSGPLFIVIRNEPLRIVTDIPESDAVWIRTGLPATLSVDGIKDRAFLGVVQRMSEMLDPKTRTLRVEIEIHNAPPALRPGMYGVVEINESRGSESGGL